METEGGREKEREKVSFERPLIGWRARDSEAQGVIHEILVGKKEGESRETFHRLESQGARGARSDSRTPCGQIQL